ncbi:methyltransferase [Pelagimonas varians]|uniref:Release factor glutamine methyltransferase n=1 Tax=Pelagimonas varians TaxID=696760 RepID=A0A238L6A5_9RHOB|nr:methyltransferase [Pelagimonas varians]PYG25459.1 methyltransferase family protein [Pelagimonas varians]SMX49846.1 Release factor glutamine methyltransferase [Pelagimonas varians]
MSLQDVFAELGVLLARYGYLDPDAPAQRDVKEAPTTALLEALFSKAAFVLVTDVATTDLSPLVPALLRAQLLVQRDGKLASNVTILRRGKLFLAGDLDQDRALSVPSFSGVTNALSRLLVPGPFEHAVDMGCGSGVLGFEMADHATKVTGTDLNPRALALARINAAMNSVSNIEFCEGSLLDPLGQVCVDMIVGNLPYVMSPDQNLLFRDGDRPAAQLLKEAVIGASLRLAPGGVAQMLCNWPHDSANPAAGPQHLVTDSGLDAIAITYAVRSPLEHARNWNRELADNDPKAFEQLAERWTNWFSSQNIDAIAFGALTLRRPDGRTPVFRHFHAASWPTGKAGRQVQRILHAIGAEDPFAKPDSSVPRLVDHTLKQDLRCEDGSYRPKSLRLLPDDTIGLGLELESRDASTLSRVDGVRKLSDVIDSNPEHARCLRRLWHLGLLDITPEKGPLH